MGAAAAASRRPGSQQERARTASFPAARGNELIWPSSGHILQPVQEHSELETQAQKGVPPTKSGKGFPSAGNRARKGKDRNVLKAHGATNPSPLPWALSAPAVELAPMAQRASFLRTLASPLRWSQNKTSKGSATALLQTSPTPPSLSASLCYNRSPEELWDISQAWDKPMAHRGAGTAVHQILPVRIFWTYARRAHPDPRAWMGVT